MSRAAAAALTCTLIVGGLLGGWLGGGQEGLLHGVPGIGVSLSPSEAPRTHVEAAHMPAAGDPVASIDIPAIGVHAHVVDLGLNGDGTLQVPARADQAGWWSGGAVPGSLGTAVVAGHVDSRVGPGVFFDLGHLEPGDRVVVRMPGREPARFAVRASQEVAKDAFPTARVYSATGTAALRLITCAGHFDESSGHYRDNLVVYASAL